MKRIKAINGYTIYQATTQRDADNHNCEVGEYNIYLSSDIRDFGLSCSYPEYDRVDSLSAAVAMCKGSSYAVAVELAEELSSSTIQDMDLVLEIERRLDAGEALETVRRLYDREGDRLYASIEEAIRNGFDPYQEIPFDPYEDHPAMARGEDGELHLVEDKCEWDEDALDGDLEDVLDRGLEDGDRADENLGYSPDETDLLIRAMRAADWSYDGLDRDGCICFGGPNRELMSFDSWPEVREWLDGVVFDDPEVSDRVEFILHPKRFADAKSSGRAGDVY